MSKPLIIDQVSPLKIEVEMSIEDCRARALQAAATFMAGRSQTREDVVRTADLFYHYIANGAVPQHERSW